MAKQRKSILRVDDLEVELTRKSMKSTRVRVAPDGKVRVSTSYLTPDWEVARFVRSHRFWIDGQKRKMANSPAARAETASKAEIEAWRREIKAAAPPLVAKWERIMGVRAGELAFRNMKTRWGSCQPTTGRICFNIRLALYPRECLEYVVVHELNHLLYPNHDAAFWTSMSRLLPDWRERRKLLR